MKSWPKEQRVYKLPDVPDRRVRDRDPQPLGRAWSNQMTDAEIAADCGYALPPSNVVPLTNPKQAYGDKKPPLHLIHVIAQLHESAAMHSGRLKYGENNFLGTPVEAMTYVGAIMRHLAAWVSGERVDRKELVHHLGAARACLNILLSTEATGMMIDNRPCVGPVEANCYPGPQSYRDATAEAFTEVERVIEHLNALYPPKDRHAQEAA